MTQKTRCPFKATARNDSHLSKITKGGAARMRPSQLRLDDSLVLVWIAALLLIAIWMTVAPIPVLVLLFVV
jgi:hypothetical protein